MWRRVIAVGGLGLVLGLYFELSGVAAAEPEPSLRALADQAGLTLGVAVDAEALAADPDYARLAGRHFHVLTPENALKWGHLEWQKGQRDTRDYAVIAAFAAAHDQTLRGHALVWDRATPAWLEASAPSAFAAALDRHLRATLVDDAPGLPVWDVVNEALGPDGQRAPSSLARRLGPTFIESTFVRARAEAPDAKLFYNDYAVLWPGPKSDGLVALVDALQRKGVPIDGVGIQSHLHLVPEGDLDWSGIQYNLRRLGARGLDVHLSEVDVRVADLAGGQTGRLLAQANAVYRLVRACRAEPACTHVAFWGVTDRYSWIDAAIGPDDPLLWDDHAEPKPAYFAVRDALAGRPWRGCDADLSGSGSSLDAWITTGASLQRVGTDQGPGVVVRERTETWHGPQLDVREWLAEGLSYRLRVEARSTAGTPLKLTLRVVDGAGTRFMTVAEATATGAWQPLDGVFRVALESPVQSVHAYVEGPPPGQDVAIRAVHATVACTPISTPHR